MTTTVEHDPEPLPSGVGFQNLRFDPDLSPLHAVAKEMAARFGYSATLSLEPRLAQLLRLRVAQLNPCSYCLILHTRVAHEIGVPPEVVANLPSWRESALFTTAEGAALAYCEALTRFDHAVFPELHDSLRLHFDEAGVAEIAAVVINMNVWTRLKLAQGATPVPQEASSHPITEEQR